MVKLNILKQEKPIKNIKEGEMVLFPFERKRKQQNASIVILVVAFLLIVGSPIIQLGEAYSISSFVLGAILGVIGLIYLLESL